MVNKSKNKIAIIGAGLGGSFLAILLANRGYKVELYEKLSFKDICDTNSNRSYNITFYSYGVDLLKKAEIWDALIPHLIRLKGVSTQLSKNSKPIFSPIYNEKAQYYSVSRPMLLTVLLKQLSKHPMVSVHLETSLLSIDRYEKTILMQNEKTKTISTVSCDVVIGADGANSLVRPFIQQGQNTHHTQEYSTGGYKQFTISKEEVKTLGLERNIAYTWGGKEKFGIAFPNFDGSLAALLIFQKDKTQFDSLQSMDAINNFIAKEFPLLLPIYKQIADQLLHNPVGSFVTIHTDPWYYKDFMTLVGDAAHGFYPFFGQGTSAAFGDCMQLVELLDKYENDWGKILPLYQEARKHHMDMLGELSKEGLKRYARNKRADYDTIYDKLEELGHSFLPKYINPPVFMQVLNDPKNTADYVDKHLKQRKIAKRLGVSLIVPVLTKIVSLYEKLNNSA